MSKTELREVSMIELHDSGVCISPENKHAEGWQEFSEYDGSEFVISGETISHIAQIFGLDPQNIEIPNTLDGTSEILKPECMEFCITKKRLLVGEKEDSRQFGGMVKIKGIRASIEGAQLLNMEIDRYYKDDESLEEYTQAVTYSGNFTVWWK